MSECTYVDSSQAIGYLVIPTGNQIGIFCDRCKSKNNVEKILPLEYRDIYHQDCAIQSEIQKTGWLLMENVPIKVTKDIKIAASKYIKKKIFEAMRNALEEFKGISKDTIKMLLDQLLVEASLELKGCYDQDELPLLRKYIESDNISHLEKCKDSIKYDDAHFCPECIPFIKEEFPEYFISAITKRNCWYCGNKECPLTHKYSNPICAEFPDKNPYQTNNII